MVMTTAIAKAKIVITEFSQGSIPEYALLAKAIAPNT
jgi:hypothetical protein